MDYLKEVKDFYNMAIFPSKGNPVGCQNKEIAEVEHQFGFQFPQAYRQFLLWMGKDVTGLFIGSNWYLKDIVQNTECLKDLLAENRVTFDLPAHYLVFFSHQGYMAAWFALPNESEDPVVYYYNECEMDKPRIEGTFTEFLLIDMQGMTNCLHSQNNAKI